MADNPYAPSNLGGVAPSPAAPAYAPSMAAPATTGYLQTLPTKPVVAPAPAPSAYAPSPLDVIAHAETGNRNIPQQIHDRNTDAGTPANGVFQFIDPTWRRQAPKAGVDIRQYPTAISAPPSVQAQVAAVTPLREWGPNTVAAVKARFPGIDVNRPPPGPYNGAAVGNAAVGSAPATPGTTLNTQPSLANILTGGTGADGKGLSPIQQAQQAFGGEGGGQALPPAAPPQLGMPSMHNQEVAAQAPQLMAALRTANAQPLSWGSQPFGSTAGPRGGPPPTTLGYFGGQAVPMPGTTLNSIGGQNG